MVQTFLVNDKTNLVPTIDNKHIPHVGIWFDSDKEERDF